MIHVWAAQKQREHAVLRNKELAESNEWRGWEGGESAGDTGGSCCGEGECLLCLSLLPVAASALPSLLGRPRHRFPEAILVLLASACCRSLLSPCPSCSLQAP